MSWNNPAKFSLQGIKRSLGYQPGYLAIQALFGNKSRNISHNGRIEFSDGKAEITLHHTRIVTWLSSGAVRVNTGGYSTITTKKWINLFSGLGISQKNFRWFIGGVEIHQHAVNTPNGILFSDGVYRWSHIDSVWAELQKNPESENWTRTQWDDFLNVFHLTID